MLDVKLLIYFTRRLVVVVVLVFEGMLSAVRDAPSLPIDMSSSSLLYDSGPSVSSIASLCAQGWEQNSVASRLACHFISRM